MVEVSAGSLYENTGAEIFRIPGLGYRDVTKDRTPPLPVVTILPVNVFADGSRRCGWC